MRGLLHSPPFVCFICAQMWGLQAALPVPFSATLSPALLVYLHECGAAGLLVVRLPAPFVPHSTSLGPATATRVLSTLAACLCHSYRSGRMFIFYFLGVGLPCHSIICQFLLCKEVQWVYLHPILVLYLPFFKQSALSASLF